MSSHSLFGLALWLGFVFTAAPLLAGRHNESKGAKVGRNFAPVTVFRGKTLKANITGFAHNKCISSGVSITVLGANFGVRKQLALVVGASYQSLSVTYWQNTKITATLPSIGLKTGTYYPVAIRDNLTQKWVSNTNKQILICAAQPQNIGGNKVPQPSPDSITPANSNQPTQNHPTIPNNDFSVPVIPSRAGFNNVGSLINRQLPSVPPKLVISHSTDEEGQGVAEPNELLVVSNNMTEARELAQQLRAYGLSAKKRKILKNLGLVLTTYRVPPNVDVQQTAATIRQAYPTMWADMNHRYKLQGNTRSTQHAKDLIQWNQGAAECGKGLRIGLVDTGVSQSHPALSTQKITAHSVLSKGILEAKKEHGTAIATLLVGSNKSASLTGLLPQAHLFSVSVFRQRAKGHTDTTAEWIVNALDWLLSKKVNVINMSIGGPQNLLLDIALQRTMQSGVIVVAAAGNGGKNALPSYPAAQQGVIAVTAIDSHLTLYSKANEGSYIDFAAPGVDVWAGTEKGRGKYVSGTSFAVPFVVAGMAILSKKNSLNESYQRLKKTSKDLGAQGKDAQYGWGLLGQLNACGI